jgi:hypothetical protein
VTINTLSYYLLFGVIVNALYDFLISTIDREDLRFNMLERILVGLFWPAYLVLLTINFIINYINGKNK